MKVIKATQQMLETRTLVLGFQGENLRTQLRIDCSATFAEYPNATPALAIKPPTGETYPVFVDRDGTEVVWDIVANNLILKGDGELQLTFYKDNVIAKTSVGHITVNRSLQIDGEMPDVVATWIENANRKLAEVDAQIVELEGMVDTATDAATRAEQSASTASTKAEQAAGSAATATEKATEATQAAGTATAKAEQATEAAQTATEKAMDASASATAAQASATDAASSATAASASETAAEASETAAGASATQAAQSAQTASTAAQTAAQKAEEAASSASNAATSATNAATSAETASTKAGEAAQSAQTVEQTAEQLADSLEQISQNTADIAEHEQEYNALKESTLIHNTASGSIASFSDGAEMPVDEVTAQINPVQDLHGYDSPWPGGGGKNLMFAWAENKTRNGITFTAIGDGSSFTVSGTAEGNVALSIITGAKALEKLKSGVTYTLSGGHWANTGVAYIQLVYKGDTTGNKISIVSTSGSVTYTPSEDATLIGIFINFVKGNTFTNDLVQPQFEIGSTASSFAPYSNICPISGFDSVKVSRTGKNLLQKPYHENRNLIAGVSVVTNDDGSITLDGTATSTFYYNFGTVGGNEKTFKAGTYTLSGGDASASKFRIVAVKDGTYFTATGNKSVTFTLAKESKIYFYGTASTGAVFSNETYYPQFELGSTATDFEPYQGETYDIAFPSEAGTVYGGELTIAEDGSGVLTVDRAYDQMTLEWINSRDSSAIGFQSAVTQVGGNSVWIRNWNSANAAPRISGGIKAICNAFPISMHNTTIFASQYRIYFGVGSIETIEEFKAAVQSLEDSGSGLWIAYELATPITYTLSASKIRTLLGKNHLWHDANGDISVGYKANTKLYIDGKIAELVAQIVNS